MELFDFNKKSGSSGSGSGSGGSDDEMKISSTSTSTTTTGDIHIIHKIKSAILETLTLKCPHCTTPVGKWWW